MLAALKAESEAAAIVTRELTLLVPGLRQPVSVPGAGSAATKSVAKLLSRAKRAPARQDVYAELGRLFDLDPETGGPADLPAAALTLLNDSGERRSGYWLRADPVHIEAGHDRLIMAGSEVLRLGREEASALCAEVNEHVNPDGLRLLAPFPTRWYFQWPEVPAVRFSPLPEVVGKDMYGHMPGGEQGRPWRRLLNQVQMVLHASHVNEERRRRGLPVINGLWFWGGGVLPPPRPSRYWSVWSDDALVRGLALNAGLSPLDLPDRAETWLSDAGPGAHLIAVMELYEAAGDEENRRALAQHFAQQWLAPLGAALRSGRLDQLALCPVDGYEYHVTRRNVRSWWRWW